MTTSTQATQGAVVAPAGPWGSVFSPTMPIARFDGAAWSAAEVVPIESFQIHPGAHALHYGSTCFEGLKAHRQPDGSAKAFRADAHAARLQGSAARLCLPVPPVELIAEMIDLAVTTNAETVPSPPGSLYLRPTLLGTDESVGKATTPSESVVLYVLSCPVGDYLPPRPLVISVETDRPRTTPQFGRVKAGANYAMAMSTLLAARERDGADQVLFAPGGVLQETGATNVALLDGHRLVTPALTDAYLHGITRDSLVRLAAARGWEVDEREITVDETLDMIASPTAELIVMGTAAVLSSVGTLIVDGERHQVGTAGATTSADELRAALIDIQTGRTTFDW